MSVIDKLSLKNASGGDDLYDIGAKAENVTYNDGGSSTNIQVKVAALDTSLSNHKNENVASSNGAHGLKYSEGSLYVKLGGDQHEIENNVGDIIDIDGYGIEQNGTSVTIRVADSSNEKWVKTYLIRKANGIPTKHDGTDGSQVFVNNIRNNYMTNGYVDTGLTSGTLYYYRFFTSISSAGTGVEDKFYAGICFTVIADSGILPITKGGTGNNVGYIRTGLYVNSTKTIGTGATIEGSTNEAPGNNSHVEGSSNISQGNNSHAEGYQTIATGLNSHAEGSSSQATGTNDHAEGYNTRASGTYGAHAEGYESKATGYSSHAEGYNSLASKKAAHAEGENTTTSGEAAHAEGGATEASGNFSHAEGQSTKAEGENSHAEGVFSRASGVNCHAEGYQTHSAGDSTHAEGSFSIAYGTNNHAEGYSTIAGDSQDENIQGCHAEGYQSEASGQVSHAEGVGTIASGDYSHAEGYNTSTEGSASHAEGNATKTYGMYCHTEGDTTKAYGNCSHAEGSQTVTGNVSDLTNFSGNNAHAEGDGSKAQGIDSHAEGHYTKAYGSSSHAEGYQTQTGLLKGTAQTLDNNYPGTYAHAEGYMTKAYGFYAHSEGHTAEAHGKSSHAEGGTSKSYGEGSHAEGMHTQTTAAGIGGHSEGGYTIANGNCSHAQGCFTQANGIGSFSGGYGKGEENKLVDTNNYDTSFIFGNTHISKFADFSTVYHGDGHVFGFNKKPIVSTGNTKYNKLLPYGGCGEIYNASADGGMLIYPVTQAMYLLFISNYQGNSSKPSSATLDSAGAWMIVGGKNDGDGTSTTSAILIPLGSSGNLPSSQVSISGTSIYINGLGTNYATQQSFIRVN